MITRTYFDKVNTITKDSPLNTGINPVAELTYGGHVSRIMLYFDHAKIKSMVEDKTYPHMEKMRHYLKMTNGGSFDFTTLHCGVPSTIGDTIKVRATSFDVIFFLIPQLWDGGKGFDYTQIFLNNRMHGKYCGTQPQDTRKMTSSDASNWFQARNGYLWDEEGIYSNETLSREYNLFSSAEGSNIVIGRQRFDIGNEDLCLDITTIMNKFITGELENYGIGLAFAPEIERTEDDLDHYVSFLTHKTNTFFEPYVETHYDDCIVDNRSHFALDKDNKLYLYANIGGKLTNLDKLPTCSVNGQEYEVKQFSKGVYYIDINLSRNDFKATTMLYDTWDDIFYHGVQLEPVELDFVTKSNNVYFNIGNQVEENTRLTPNVYGIDSDERIKRGDVRKVVIQAKVDYKRNMMELIDDMEYRLYVLDGQREIDVIPYEKCNMAFNENFFQIDTDMLVPQEYHLDIKFKYNLEMIMHHDVLRFKVVDSLKNLYN